MRSAAAAVLAAAAPAACDAPAPPGPPTAADSLARIELGFAAAARQGNVRDAFLAHIADDGILFRPGPVHGRETLERQEPGPAVLAWRPIYAEVAASGDLGFTTGPWSFRPRPDTADVAFGHFVTIWKKQADGAWRFVLDIGVSTMPDTAYPHDVETRQADAAPAAADVEDLIQRERSLSEAASRDGYPIALIAALGPGARVLRPGARPALGTDAARALLPDGAIVWSPIDGDVSAAGDLGYTWGDYELRPDAAPGAERGNYLHVWRRAGGEWRIALDLLSPLPTPAPEAAASAETLRLARP
jgi:ketosteroid isomerase-like protein